MDSFPGIRIPHRSEFTDLMVNHNSMTFAAGPRPRSAVLNVSFENGLGGETHTYVVDEFEYIGASTEPEPRWK